MLENGRESSRLVASTLAKAVVPALLALAFPLSTWAFEFSGPTEQVAAPGETVTWVVSMSDIATNPPGPIEALYLQLSYDANALAITASRAGSFFPAANTSFVPNNNVAGQYNVSIVPVSGQSLLEGGQVLEIDFQIAPGAADGPITIDLTASEVNEGYLSAVLGDGVITVQAPQQEAVYRSNLMTIIQVCQVIGC